MKIAIYPGRKWDILTKKIFLMIHLLRKNPQKTTNDFSPKSTVPASTKALGWILVASQVTGVSDQLSFESLPSSFLWRYHL